MRVGVEVGGTFTDLIAVDEGNVSIAKVPSTPANPDQGALNALRQAELDLSQVTDLVHGSTVATNAILERKGAPVAFITTKGFRDILFLQRHNRTRIYDLFYKKPVPVIQRRHIFEVDERIDGHGAVVQAIDVSALKQKIGEFLNSSGYQSVAICLLNSYRNSVHEKLVAAAITQDHPQLSVTCSADVSGEFREYERASTATLSAYVQPVIDGYLKRFQDSLTDGGFAGRFSVMQSNGGRIPAEGMGQNAITSLFSGPAAGVIGALRQAGNAGFDNVITLDMGGTSTDICLIADGKAALATETEVDGLPIRTPVLDIVTVGAGGGSICWADDGGLLRVGPQSAGATPGPACYGRGGEEPTISDAHLIRGSLQAAAFLGGEMDIDGDASASVFEKLSKEFDTSLAEIADTVIRIADNNIVRAIQLVSTERGRDPRDYVLAPFGGAGPLHAARVAEELGIAKIIVPPNAGVLSAYGLLAADFERFLSRTRRVEVDDLAADVMRELFAELQQQAKAEFEQLGIAGEIVFTHNLEMRYVGQAFEISVEFTAGEIEKIDKTGLLQAFSNTHNRVFSFGDAGLSRAEIVSFRLGITAPQAAIPALAAADEADGFKNEITVFDQGREQTFRNCGRGALKVGSMYDGPLLIDDVTSTIFVPAGWCASRDNLENVIMTRSNVD